MMREVWTMRTSEVGNAGDCEARNEQVPECGIPALPECSIAVP
jgi:hypothetical protein